MDVYTAKAAAAHWGVSQRRISVLCSEGRINGAELVGKMWLIPKSAQKPEDARTTRFLPDKNAPIRPFLKWAGGKSQILHEIRKRYPAGLGKSITKYAEPFVGGGAVLFDILASYSLSDIYISDINRELILTYKIIRDGVSDLIDVLQMLENEYLTADTDTRKTIYYRNRDSFNALKAEQSASAELAALFLFLNRTCFNGLYRVNRKGGYNVPQGSYNHPTICDENNLRAVSDKLQNVQIICCNYKLSREFIDTSTFVYFDPPYRPLTATANFTAYSCDGFGDAEQIELARFIDEMTELGAWVVASNSDPKNIDEHNDFFDRIYSRYKITRINATRAINSLGSSRGCVRELLIARL
ncbi:restriction endonuclease subunit M [Deltaproteobacteria bacterium]|nr:restriction endonuclease subunit M [Deltaproteobacteria bacterium]